jgi:hypothetical protein
VSVSTSLSIAYSLGGAGWKEAPYHISYALVIFRQRLTYLLNAGSKLLDGSSKQLLLGIVNLANGQDLLNTGFLAR